jgi:hypothetical protein
MIGIYITKHTIILRLAARGNGGNSDLSGSPPEDTPVSTTVALLRF